jgi:hypothetical protein
MDALSSLYTQNQPTSTPPVAADPLAATRGMALVFMAVLGYGFWRLVR